MAPLVDFIMIQIARNEYVCHLFVANNIGMGSDSLMEKVGWCKHFFSSCAVISEAQFQVYQWEKFWIHLLKNNNNLHTNFSDSIWSKDLPELHALPSSLFVLVIKDLL